MNSEEHNIFTHILSDVQTKKIGKGTTVWQFAVVLENAVIGENCNINCHTFIENDVLLGHNVTIKSGVYLWDGIIIEDNVFIGPNVTFTNDSFPRSKIYPDSFQHVLIKKGASVGANATILGNKVIGSYALVGAGSVVTKDVPDFSIVCGNPARIVGWIDEFGNKLKSVDDCWISKSGNKYKVENNQLIIIK